MTNLQKILSVIVGGVLIYFVSLPNYNIEDTTQKWIPANNPDVTFYLLNQNEELVVVGFTSKNELDQEENIQDFYNNMLLENRINNVGVDQALELTD